MEQIIVATKNKGKAAEFRTFFQAFGINVKSLLDVHQEIPDIAETGTTFKENAALKAEKIASLLQEPVVSDDSGLEITALNGEPGVYSARYAGPDKNDQANIDKVLLKLEGVPLEKRQARFMCMLAIAVPKQETIFRAGVCGGKIAHTQKGSHGFGYDPIFIPDGYTKTMAELPPFVKNEISHRQRAFSKIESWFESFSGT